MHRLVAPLMAASALLVAGCASRAPVVAIAPPITAPLPVVAMPAGASPGMAIPIPLADGSYPTPNRNVSAAAAIWHLRAGLDVAALACRGTQEDAIIARYNALLIAQKATLAAAEARLASEYRATGAADWRDRYDDAMTRLYNYYSQSPARDAFCASADRVLAETAATPATPLTSFAAARLADLDRPFTDFYRAYDAWRSQRMPAVMAQAAPPRPMIALAAASPVARAPETASPVARAPERIVARAPAIVTRTTPPPIPPRPRLELDPSVFLEN